MIIYEVNLTINNDIFNEYYPWLMDHIKIMLKFRGFQHAEIAKEKIMATEENKNTNITVRYFIENELDLEDYFTHHAKTMREEGIQKFGDQFSATRRIFVESISVS